MITIRSQFLIIEMLKHQMRLRSNSIYLINKYCRDLNNICSKEHNNPFFTGGGISEYYYDNVGKMITHKSFTDDNVLNFTTAIQYEGSNILDVKTTYNNDESTDISQFQFELDKDNLQLKVTYYKYNHFTKAIADSGVGNPYVDGEVIIDLAKGDGMISYGLFGRLNGKIKLKNDNIILVEPMNSRDWSARFEYSRESKISNWNIFAPGSILPIAGNMEYLFDEIVNYAEGSKSPVVFNYNFDKNGFWTECKNEIGNGESAFEYTMTRQLIVLK